MLLNFLHEFVNNWNSGQFDPMDTGLQVNSLGGIRMMVTPDINLKSSFTGRTVQR